MSEREISDLQCPMCVAVNRRVGDGEDFADRHFNAGGAFWGVCAVHGVRWYVTRQLGLGEEPKGLDLPEVEGVWLPSK